MAAQRLECELVTDAKLSDTIASEFGAQNGIPDKAWPHLATSILAKLGVQQHLVISSIGSELLLRNIPGVLRAHVVAPESRRLGNSCWTEGWSGRRPSSSCARWRKKRR